MDRQTGILGRASSGARILLLMARGKDRELLGEWLERTYTVEYDPADAASALTAIREGEFDLIILDGPTLESLWYDIRTLRQEQSEVFLPFLLVTSRRGVGPDTAEVWQVIDEMILKPIEKIELHARVEILLRARRYSHQLQTRYYSLAELAPIGIVMLYGDGVISYVNRWMENVLHIDRGNLVGTRLDEHQIEIFDRTGRELIAEERPFFRVLEEGGEIYDQRFTFIRPDGSHVHLSVNGARLSTAEVIQGNGAILTVMDITKQAEYERSLRSARNEAEEVTRLKSAFLANLSHEIRTPLTGILSFSEIIATEVTGELQEFAELIQISGSRLMETFDSLIDLAQLESSSWMFEEKKADVSTIVIEVLSRFKGQAAVQGLDLRIDGADESLFVYTDPHALRRVLQNLLSNAVKFTRKGHIVVRLERLPEHIQISIEDTGIGIGNSFSPYMFDAFKQESQGSSRNFEGSGLGLTVTKQLVELLGGEIDATSNIGEGSTFRVRLPASRASDDDTIDGASISTRKPDGP